HEGPPFASHERMADFFADISHALTDAMLSGALADLARRDASGAIRHVTGYLVALAAHAPYLIAAAGEQKERDLLTRLDHETAARGHPPSRDLASPRVLLFTDTLADVNGVSRFIRDVAGRAHAAGHDLTVITSTNKPFDPHPAVVNLRP